jgi:hypothetical protein
MEERSEPKLARIFSEGKTETPLAVAMNSIPVQVSRGPKGVVFASDVGRPRHARVATTVESHAEACAGGEVERRMRSSQYARHWQPPEDRAWATTQVTVLRAELECEEPMEQATVAYRTPCETTFRSTWAQAELVIRLKATDKSRPAKRRVAPEAAIAPANWMTGTGLSAVGKGRDARSIAALAPSDMPRWRLVSSAIRR